MTTLELHGRLSQWSAEQREECLAGDFAIQAPGGLCDAWSAAAAAAADLSGVDPIDNDEDIKNALAHFQTLLSAGVVTEETWKTETMRVLEELFRFGSECTARLAAIAESN